MAIVRGLLLIYGKFFVGFKKSWLWHVESRQSKLRTVSVKNSRIRDAESRRSNSVPGDQEEMWRYRNCTRLAFQQKVSNGKRECTSNVAPLSSCKQVTVYLIHRVLKTSCPVDVNHNHTKRRGGLTPGYEAESCRGLHTRMGELMMTNPTMSNRRTQ